MNKIKFLLSFLISVAAGNASVASAAQCSKDNFDMCKTCEQLSNAIDLKNPNHGNYYRGALWNGLYTSYVKDCPAVAEKLLSNGATPSYGGSMGSMGATLTDKWPHNDEKINLSWADLLIKHGFDVNKYTAEYKSAAEAWALSKESVQYTSVRNKLINSSELKPIEPSRNLEWCASDNYRLVVVYSIDSCLGNAIKRLDDGVSSASDISSASVNSCAKDIENFKKNVACSAAIKKGSDSEQKLTYQFMVNDSQIDKGINEMLKEKYLEKVLELRAERREKQSSQ